MDVLYVVKYIKYTNQVQLQRQLFKNEEKHVLKYKHKYVFWPQMWWHVMS